MISALVTASYFLPISNGLKTNMGKMQPGTGALTVLDGWVSGRGSGICNRWYKTREDNSKANLISVNEIKKPGNLLSKSTLYQVDIIQELSPLFVKVFYWKKIWQLSKLCKLFNEIDFRVGFSLLIQSFITSLRVSVPVACTKLYDHRFWLHIVIVGN